MPHIVTKFGFVDQHPRLPDTLAPVLREQTARLTRIASQWAGECDAVEADAHLSAEGRSAKLDGLAEKYTPVLDSLDGEAFAGRTPRAIRAEAEALRATMVVRFDIPTAGVEATLRAREIRDRLLALPDADRLAIALTAADANDVETLRAIKTAPPAFPVLAPDRWQAVELRHRTHHDAARARTLEDLERLAEALDYNMDLARRTVRGNGLRRRAA